MALQDFFNVGDDGLDTGSLTAWHSQNFTANQNYSLESVKILISSATSGDVTVSIRAIDGSNKPTGADLASGVIPSASIGSTNAWLEATMGTPYNVTGSTAYAIVVRNTSGTNHRWAYDNANGYAGTANIINLSSDSGATWTNDTVDDFMFETYGTGAAGAVTTSRKHTLLMMGVG